MIKVDLEVSTLPDSILVNRLLSIQPSCANDSDVDKHNKLTNISLFFISSISLSNRSFCP